MRVLFLVHRFPYPPNRGDRIRSYHTLRFLSTWAKVDLACLADEPYLPEEEAALRGLCRRVAIASVGGLQRWIRAGQSMLRRRSLTEGLFFVPELQQTIRRWVAEEPYDAVLVFCSSMARYIPCPKSPETRLVVDLVDVDSEKFFDYARVSRQGTIPKRWLYRWEAQRLRQLEIALTEQADSVLLVSEDEADLFRRIAPSHREKIHPLTNGVDLEYFNPQEITDAELEDVCVFVGALDYEANIDGLQWFCREIWPAAREAVPGLRLLMVGRRPVPAVEQLARLPGVELVGQVPDVRPYLAQASFVVAPLNVARGVQNKVLEAAAMGKAVVASPQAAEGLELVRDQHLLVPDDVQGWVDAMKRLSQDRELRRRLGASSRNQILDRYTWESRLQPLKGFLSPACASAGVEADPLCQEALP